MHIGLFLHIYQPPTQFPYMVRRIVSQSYEKIVDLLEKFPEAKVTLNINASLTEQLDDLGFESLLKRIKALAESGQIEFTGSAAYHPILPDIPKREIIRQINLNNGINQSYFGSAYETRGFFPPEMAYDDKVGEVVEGLGFKWILVDDSAIDRDITNLGYVYQRSRGKLLVFPREGNLSFKIAFGRIKTFIGLVRAIRASNLKRHRYLILALDGETFGHHQPKQLKLLQRIFEANKEDKRMSLVKISEIEKHYPKRRSVRLNASTWGYTEEIDGKKVWVRWGNHKNPVHKLLGELRNLAISAINTKDERAREVLDKALNSDTFWWASGKPFWHPGMVRKGARMFLRAISYSKATREDKTKARNFVYVALEKEMLRMRTRNQRKKILGEKE